MLGRWHSLLATVVAPPMKRDGCLGPDGNDTCGQVRIGPRDGRVEEDPALNTQRRSPRSLPVLGRCRQQRAAVQLTAARVGGAAVGAVAVGAGAVGAWREGGLAGGGGVWGRSRSR